MKEYFLKKLGNVEADIYRYTLIDRKTKFAAFLEFMQNGTSIVFTFFFVSIFKAFVSISKFFPIGDSVKKSIYMDIIFQKCSRLFLATIMKSRCGYKLVLNVMFVFSTIDGKIRFVYSSDWCMWYWYGLKK